MDRRSRGGFRLAAVAGFVIAGAVVLFVVFQIFMGSDYVRTPIDVDDPDGGAQVIVEPGDEISVGLLGHPAHPEAAWVITEIDETVIEIQSAVHEPKAGGAPPAEVLTSMPQVVQELWSTLPERNDPPDYEDEGEGPIWYWPMSRFSLTGRDFGESDVRLELRVEGELIHSFAFSVSVIDGDACDYFVSQESSIKVPHRCG